MLSLTTGELMEFIGEYTFNIDQIHKKCNKQVIDHHVCDAEKN
jgi:hypothetical protein